MIRLSYDRKTPMVMMPGGRRGPGHVVTDALIRDKCKQDGAAGSPHLRKEKGAGPARAGAFLRRRFRDCPLSATAKNTVPIDSRSGDRTGNVGTRIARTRMLRRRHATATPFIATINNVEDGAA